jgi:hypothetical protein
MLKSDLDNAVDVCRLIFELTQNEGDEVQVCHPNADFGGPESTIFVVREFGDPKQYVGSNVLDCLRQARAEDE